MKTTMMIYQELNELVRDAKNLDGINRRTAFEETKWYSEAEVEEILWRICDERTANKIWQELGL